MRKTRAHLIGGLPPSTSTTAFRCVQCSQFVQMAAFKALSWAPLPAHLLQPFPGQVPPHWQQPVEEGYRPCCSEYCAVVIQRRFRRWQRLSPAQKEAEIALYLLAT